MTIWMNRQRKKNIANIAAGTIIITTKAAARVRLVKIRNGSSGCSTRVSTSTKTASSTTPSDQADDGAWCRPSPFRLPARERP